MSLHPRQSVLLLLLLLLGSGWCGLGLMRLQFDYNIERLFPDADPELQFFRQFRERFENENDILAIALYREQGIFDATFLQLADSLNRSLATVPEVKQVSSLTNADFRKLNALGLGQSVPLIHLNEPERYAADSAFLFSVPHFRYSLLSPDGRSLCVYLHIAKNLSAEQADSLLQRVRAEVGRLDFEKVHYAGGVYTQRSQTKLVERELASMAILSVLLILGFLWWAFRSLWGVLLPLLVVGLSAVWTLGIMGWLGVEINVMTVLIPSILFVVGVSDVVHLFNRYLEELRHDIPQTEALGLAWKEVGLATFLTSLTTALGFLTLLGAGIGPYQQLGGFAALGVMIAYGLTFSLLPAILSLLPRPEARIFFRQAETWQRQLTRLFDGLLRQRKRIQWATLLVLLLSLAGLSQLEVQAFLTDELAPHHPLRQDTEFFEQHYGGIRPFTMSLQVGDSASSMLEPKVLREADRLEQYLRRAYGVNRLYSLTGNLKAANSSLHEGLPHFYRLPRSDASLQKLAAELRFFGKENGLYDVLQQDERESRLSGSLADVGLQAVEGKNQALMRFIADSIDASLLLPHLTGSGLLLDRSHRTVVNNMLAGLGLGVLVVALLMGLLYRSWRMWLIALTVNLLPLLMIGGLMGWLGINLKMSTAVIFSLAFGIAVDDTIHFISKLRLELQRGKALPQAIQHTFLSTGKAIILTSMILAAGFWVLVSSDFQGTFYTGLLVGLTLVFALLADMVLLPVLLVRGDKV